MTLKSLVRYAAGLSAAAVIATPVILAVPAHADTHRGPYKTKAACERDVLLYKHHGYTITVGCRQHITYFWWFDTAQ